MAANGFILREFRGIRYYSCEAFEQIQNLRHGFSTREGGSSNGSLNLNYSSWDSAERVEDNRRRFMSALRLENAKLATLRQTHSNCAHIIEDSSGDWNDSEGDALATRVENIAIAVKTADCLPVLLADPDKRAVAAVHAGWRGVLAGILPQTINKMRRVFNCSPSDLVVAIGPGIRACCFEVGEEVFELFKKDYPHLAWPAANRPNKFYVDLCAALNAQLEYSGVRAENRLDLGECTACNTGRYFSYRAEGAASGRMMAVIGLNRHS